MIAMYVIAGVIYYYIGWGVFIILMFVFITLCARKTHYLHVHHYTVGMVIIALIGYQSIPAAIIQGFCNGMMIEGGCRWGYDPIWNKRKPSEQQAQELPDRPETLDNSEKSNSESKPTC